MLICSLLLSVNDMSVTIKNIAESRSLSPITVSRALRGSKAVAPNTREIVKKLADKVGYYGNLHARNLRVGKTYTIAAIVSPPLTTVRQHPVEIGCEGAKLLLRMIKDDNIKAQAETMDVRIGTCIVERDSVCICAGRSEDKSQ